MNMLAGNEVSGSNRKDYRHENLGFAYTFASHARLNLTFVF
jgi:hypothetical protein